MKRKVLLVTNTVGFGYLIQQTLEDTQRYDVHLVSFSELKSAAGPADLLIVDTDYGMAEGEALEAYGDQAAWLRAAFPQAVFVLVPPKNDTGHPLVARLNPAGLLTKPFYLPDFVDTVDAFVPERAAPIAPPGAPPIAPPAPPRPAGELRVVRKKSEMPAWLQDVSRAAQYLARLSLESSAQAALIIRSDALWAYAGQMDQAEVQELTNILAAYRAQTRPLVTSGSPSRADLARYTRLPASGKEVMVYATALSEGLQLVLAYDATTPFSMIRAQASRLAHVLATHPDQPENLSLGPAPEQPQVASQPLPLADQALPNLDFSAFRTPPEAPADLEAQAGPAASPPPAGLPDPDLGSAPLVYANLVYTCMLIPRLPNQYLTGDLAARLGEWLPQVCLSFGWRLENLTVNPDHVLWVVRASPSTSPSYLMRIIRQHTSRLVFDAFAALSRENPSGDFWAPGHLIISAAVPPPEALVRDFIKQTRLHQINPGLMPPRIQR